MKLFINFCLSCVGIAIAIGIGVFINTTFISV